MNWLNTKLIEISPAPASGADILLRRNTPKDKLGVVFSGGSVLKSNAINSQALQSLFIAQEAMDLSEAADNDVVLAIQQSEEALLTSRAAKDTANEAKDLSEQSDENSNSALTKSEEALETANAIDEKAQEALDTSQEALDIAAQADDKIALAIEQNNLDTIMSLYSRVEDLEEPGSVTTEKLADKAVSNLKLADMPEGTAKGRRKGSGSGPPENLDADELRKIINSTGFRTIEEINLTTSVSAIVIDIPDDVKWIRLIGHINHNQPSDSFVFQVSTDGTNYHSASNSYSRWDMRQGASSVTAEMVELSALNISPGGDVTETFTILDALIGVGSDTQAFTYKNDGFSRNTGGVVRVFWSGYGRLIGKIKKIKIYNFNARPIDAGTRLAVEGF